MTNPITACHKCGSSHFSILASSVFKAQLGRDGVLQKIDFDPTELDNAGYEIDSVSCWECLEEHSDSDFNHISLEC